MNDQTGMAYFFKDKQEIEKLKKELEVLQQSITILQRGPTAKCPCCKGNGSVQKANPTPEGVPNDFGDTGGHR